MILPRWGSWSLGLKMSFYTSMKLTLIFNCIKKNASCFLRSCKYFSWRLRVAGTMLCVYQIPFHFPPSGHMAVFQAPLHIMANCQGKSHLGLSLKNNSCNNSSRLSSEVRTLEIIRYRGSYEMKEGCPICTGLDVSKK